jgi:hypothetical protein
VSRGGRHGVLYAVACGAPPARDVGMLVGLAKRDGWDVCVVATPDALKWLDVPALAARTGHPVRSRYKAPGEPDLLPPPDAVIVAPATSNTINKWAAGITDTLALGLVVEATGDGIPVVAIPSTSRGLASYPAFGRSLRTLRRYGVTVVDDPADRLRPGVGGPGPLPWQRGLDALNRRTAAARSGRPRPAGGTAGSATGSATGSAAGGTAGGTAGGAETAGSPG